MGQRKRPAGFPEIAPSLSKRVCIETTPNNTSPSPQPRTFTDKADSMAETSTTSRSTSRRPKKYFCEYKGCDKAFDRPVRLEAHVRTHTDDRPFICEEDGCTKRFFKPEHLKAHVQNKHKNEANYTCTYVFSVSDSGEKIECGKSFTTGTRLRRHVTAHEQKEQTRCPEVGCGQVFRKVETLQRHIKKEHLKEKAFRCTAVIISAIEHMEGVEEECGQTFSTISQLKVHVNREHAGPRYFCERCPSHSPTSQEREEDHEDDISAVLDNMQAPGFPTYADLQAHIRTVHPPTCSICSKHLPSSKALAAHMDIVHGSQPLSERQKFACSYQDCGRAFTRVGNLKVHIQNVHVKNKRFVCGVFDLTSNDKVPDWDGHGCGMGFGTKANLESHVRTQHLDLLDLQRSKRTRRVKSEEADYPTPLLTEANTPDALFAPATPGNSQTTLSMLTGQGYDTTRPHACWNAQCAIRFTREYDLAQHMELVHGWNVDDINERFAELAALQGEDFWISGKEEVEEDIAWGLGDTDTCDSMFEEDDKSRFDRCVHNADLPTLEMERWKKFSDANIEDRFLEPMDVAEEDTLVVDPALIEL